MSREKRYTPGPWKWSPEYTDRGGRFIAINNDSYDEVVGQSGIWSNDNAHLIASAPELLEACELMLDKMDEVSDPYVLDAYEQIESAVKKAYGEAPC